MATGPRNVSIPCRLGRAKISECILIVIRSSHEIPFSAIMQEAGGLRSLANYAYFSEAPILPSGQYYHFLDVEMSASTWSAAVPSFLRTNVMSYHLVKFPAVQHPVS